MEELAPVLPGEGIYLDSLAVFFEWPLASLIWRGIPNFLFPAMFLNDSANSSENEHEPHSAFTQTEHNIVAAYLITAGMKVLMGFRTWIKAFCVNISAVVSMTKLKIGFSL